MRRLIALLLALTLCGCAAAAQESGISIFYLAPPESETLLGCEVWPEPDPTADALAERMLTPPQSEDLSSPYPEGVSLRGWTLEDGTLTLDFSEAYSDLSGISLTLANFCAVNTCAQLPGVERVAITVEGQPLPEGSSGPFAPSDVLDTGEGEKEPENPTDHIDEAGESK